MAGVLIQIFFPSQCVAQGVRERRVLSSEARTTVISQPPFAKNDLGAIRLFHGLSLVWRSQKGDVPPFIFVFELGASARINLLRFTNVGSQRLPGSDARQVDIEFSVEGPYSGYEKIGSFILEEGNISQDFMIPWSRARWIRLTISSNYGHPDYTELREIEAWGRFDTKFPLVIAHFIWILGAAILLAVFSLHEYKAFKLKKALRESLISPSFRKPATFGGILVVAGVFAVVIGSSARVQLLIVYGLAGVFASGAVILKNKARKLLARST